MSRVVLVTGATGFVGNHLMKALERETPVPTIIGWRRPGPKGPQFGKNNRVSWYEVDLLKQQDVDTALSETKPTEIFHCGGIANVAGSWKNVLDTLDVNVRGTKHLLNGLRRLRMRSRTLVPGSGLVYLPKAGPLAEEDAIRPVNPYGLSKLAQEMLALQLNSGDHEILVTRSFTHIGPGQDTAYAVSNFAHQIARIELEQTNPIIHVGSLDAYRDLMDVRDTVEAYRTLMHRGKPGQIYNVCTGHTYKIGDVLDRLIKCAHVPIEVRLDPDRVRPSDNPEMRGDRSKITAAVGWTPKIQLDDTLRDTLNYWREQISG